MANTLRERCADAKTFDELREVVCATDPTILSAADHAVINRVAARLATPEPIKFAFAGSHSMEPLPLALKAHGVGLGLSITDFTCPYGQYMQQILAEDSELRKERPDFLFLSIELRQVAKGIVTDFAAHSEAELIAIRQAVLDHVAEAAESASRRLGATVLIGNFPRPADPALGVADGKAALGESEFYLTLNLELMRRFKASNTIHVLDLDRLAGGAAEQAPDRMYFFAKILWSSRQANLIAREILRYVVAATGRARKCLVLDLDNTLWGGVAGEDGAEGVQVGPGSPASEAFESFQHTVRALRHRGIMLAICSKNNPEDAEAVFALRQDMPLKLTDFSATEISWDPKPVGISKIAGTLNIGLDSLVFADDNPAERAMLRGACPEVTVLEMPRDPAEYAAFLRRQLMFEKLHVSVDDVVRLEQFAVQQRREDLRAQAGDLEKYLLGLGTRVLVRPARQSDLPRIHELFNKTNQFNLTTRRYSLADVERFYSEPQYILGIATAQDNFSSLGTIAVFLVETAGRDARLDSFLMSCRALGRGIESAVMNSIKRLVIGELECAQLGAEFIPTAKNAPAREFLAAESFALAEAHDNGSQRYALDGPALGLRPCPHLTVTDELEIGVTNS